MRPGAQGTTADEIEYQNTRYRVQAVQDWRPHAGLEIHAIRVEGQSWTSIPETIPLERAVRAYVAEGSGLLRQRVRPGNAPGLAPQDLYATVLLIQGRPPGDRQHRAHP